MFEVNFLAIFVSAIASMVIGSVWFGPLFGKIFMRAMGMDQWTPEQRAAMTKKMWISYAGQFAASLVMFFVLARFIDDIGALTIRDGFVVALWVWVGFVLPIKIGDVLWGGKPALFWLTSGNMLITLLVSGIIIGAWG